MLDVNLRFQIAAFLLMLIIVIDYLRCPKLNLISRRLFTLMLGFSVLNLLLDAATVYSVFHLDTVPPWLNRLLHQMFIGTLDCAIFLLFLYIVVLGRSTRHMKAKYFLLISAPFVFSMVMVIFGSLSYHVDETGAYSYGPMAVTVYLSVTFYILMIYGYLIRFRSLYLARTRAAIWGGTAIWIIAAVIQFFYPKVLLSGLALALMITYIYVSFENPKDRIDRQTQCFTRRALHMMLGEAFSQSKPFYVVNFVLDDLADVNNSVGYLTAATLLGHVGAEMHKQMGEPIFRYRWNSLALIAQDKDEQWLRDKLETALERFDHRWQLNDVKVYLHCHADVLECPRFADSADKVYDLLEFQYARDFSDALPSIRFADEESVKRHSRHLLIEKMLKSALENDGLQMVYQPIYSVADGGFVSAEALVRLKDTQTLGFVSPEEFIPVAEKIGCIADLGEAVLDKVCAFAAKQKLWTSGMKYIEVNLSAVQIEDAGLPQQVDAIFKRHGTPARFINFEITESAAIHSRRQLKVNMEYLRAMGCSFSMDDFGTGYSNIAQMERTRYDLVKLDKSLIWPCFEEAPEQPRVILNSVVTMIHGLNIAIVAEGIETQEQADALTAMGIHYFQGYLYSRPLSEDAFMDFLQCRTQTAEHVKPATSV